MISSYIPAPPYESQKLIIIVVALLLLLFESFSFLFSGLSGKGLLSTTITPFMITQNSIINSIYKIKKLYSTSSREKSIHVEL